MDRLLAFLVGLIAFQTFGIAQTASTFAVSSVHLSRPETKGVIYRVPGGVFRADGVTLRFLILWAYELPEEKLTGTDGWMSSTHFDIRATPETEVSGNRVLVEKAVRGMVKGLPTVSFCVCELSPK